MQKKLTRAAAITPLSPLLCPLLYSLLQPSSCFIKTLIEFKKKKKKKKKKQRHVGIVVSDT